MANLNFNFDTELAESLKRSLDLTRLLTQEVRETVALCASLSDRVTLLESERRDNMLRILTLESKVKTLQAKVGE